MTLTNVEPTNEPATKPMSRPTFPLLGPKFTKFRVHTAMTPPMATTGSKRRGMLKIVLKPTADMAAAKANSQYSWWGVMLRLVTKLLIPHTLMAIAIPKAMAATMSRSEEHTSELQSRQYLVCRLLLEKKKTNRIRLNSSHAHSTYAVF